MHKETCRCFSNNLPDNPMIHFHLAIVPPKATSQSAGKRMAIINGRPMFFKNKAAASAEHDYLTLCAPHKPAQPIDGAVLLSVAFVFPWRKSESKRRRALGQVYMTTKPDCSNAIKAFEDCLTKLGFWHDDGQVADLRVSKCWGDSVGITIAITPLEDQSAAGPAAGTTRNHSQQPTFF